jgi:hypothetical protein
MNLFSAIISSGIWPALPLTGYLLSRRPNYELVLKSLPNITFFSLMTASGIAIWSFPLVISAMLGIYRAEYFGFAGWIFSLLALMILGKKGLFPSPSKIKFSRWDWVLTAVLMLAALLYFGFPNESIVINADEGLYANHGVYIAKHGRMDVDYPWPKDVAAIFDSSDADNVYHWPGLYPTHPSITVQFSHLLPVWLAQAFSIFEQHGLFRLNAIFAMLSLGIFYGLCRSVLPVSYSVIATLFLALNPGELWVSRITLTEILAQLFIWSGLLLMFHAVRNNEHKTARWAGFLLAFSAFARIDSFLLVPLLFISHLLQKIIAKTDRGKALSIWNSFYQTAIPLFGFAVVYYMLDSRPYFLANISKLQQIGILTLISLCVLMVAPEKILKFLRPCIINRATFALVGMALFILIIYLYVFRPANALLNGFGDRNFSDFSLINLAQYISPLVIFWGIAGWFLSFLAFKNSKENLCLISVMLCFAGYASLYLWKPSIFPGHFWAIRRFVPVVIPGFILFASIGTLKTLNLFPKKLSVIASVIILGFLAFFTIKSDKLIFTFTEQQGVFLQLKELSEKLPDDTPVIAHGNFGWIMPLYLTFQKPVILVDLNSKEGGKVFNDWISYQASKHKPVFLLYEGQFKSSELQYSQIFSRVLSRSYTENTPFPLPSKILQDKKSIGFYRITGRL